MKDRAFRNWVRELWMENCEERLTYNEIAYKMQEYWQQYKWWLRREYRYQQRK
jgi:hypothetical protein